MGVGDKIGNGFFLGLLDLDLDTSKLFDHVTQQYSRTESINTKIDIEEVTIERIPALRCPLMPKQIIRCSCRST